MKFKPSKKYRISIAVITCIILLIGCNFIGFSPLTVTISILIPLARFFIAGLRYYAITDNGVSTKKLFTTDVSVSTPYRNISDVREYANPLEAILNCGTVEIETNSGRVLKWDSIEHPETAAKMMGEEIKRMNRT